MKKDFRRQAVYKALGEIGAFCIYIVLFVLLALLFSWLFVHHAAITITTALLGIIIFWFLERVSEIQKQLESKNEWGDGT